MGGVFGYDLINWQTCSTVRLTELQRNPIVCSNQGASSGIELCRTFDIVLFAARFQSIARAVVYIAFVDNVEVADSIICQAVRTDLNERANQRVDHFSQYAFVLTKITYNTHVFGVILVNLDFTFLDAGLVRLGVQEQVKMIVGLRKQTGSATLVDANSDVFVHAFLQGKIIFRPKANGSARLSNRNIVLHSTAKILASYFSVDVCVNH